MKKEKKDKEMEKDHIEVTPEGHTTIAPGKEPLKKPGMDSAQSANQDANLDLEAALLNLKRKSVPLKKRWEMLKADLNNTESIPHVDDVTSDPGGSGNEDSDQEEMDENHILNHPDVKDLGNEEMSEEELEDTLGKLGYSPREIAYIIHGHHVMPTEIQQQAEADKQLQQAQLNSDQGGITSESSQSTGDPEQDAEAANFHVELEKEHATRMKDLEYENARRKMELELKYKELELKRKLQSKKEDSKDKARE